MTPALTHLALHVRDLEAWSAIGTRKSTRDKDAGTVFPARPRRIGKDIRARVRYDWRWSGRAAPGLSNP